MDLLRDTKRKEFVKKPSIFSRWFFRYVFYNFTTRGWPHTSFSFYAIVVVSLNKIFQFNSIQYILVLILSELVIDCFELKTFIPLIFNWFLLLFTASTLSKMKLKKCLSSKLKVIDWYNIIISNLTFTQLSQRTWNNTLVL